MVHAAEHRDWSFALTMHYAELMATKAAAMVALVVHDGKGRDLTIQWAGIQNLNTAGAYGYRSAGLYVCARLLAAVTSLQLIAVCLELLLSHITACCLPCADCLREARIEFAGSVVEEEGDSKSIAFPHPFLATAFCLAVRDEIEGEGGP